MIFRFIFNKNSFLSNILVFRTLFDRVLVIRHYFNICDYDVKHLKNIDDIKLFIFF